MKKMSMVLLLFICLGCEEEHWSHTETARIVVESFYHEELPTLQKHTTPESFNNFMNIRDRIPTPETHDSGFEVLQDTVMGETAWVKFTTAFEDQPETFKLVKENERWKVTEIELGEDSPFEGS